jgi:hypothetical protein
MRLKASEVKNYRLSLLTEQGHKCALCQQELDETEAVLDHDHKSGYIRGVLHRGCNSLEGKIANSLVMNRITPDRLQTIFDNYIFYTNQHLAVLHPTHRTAEEKKLRANKRAKLRRQRASKSRTTNNI